MLTSDRAGDAVRTRHQHARVVAIRCERRTTYVCFVCLLVDKLTRTYGVWCSLCDTLRTHCAHTAAVSAHVAAGGESAFSIVADKIYTVTPGACVASVCHGVLPVSVCRSRVLTAQLSPLSGGADKAKAGVTE
jgi:hypothetical protein